MTYHTARQKSGGNYVSENSDSNFTTHAGSLGIVSKTIEVVDKDASGNNLTNVEVDGSVLAFDTFDATDTGSRPQGTFQSMGGYIANSSGSFGNVYLNGTLASGLGESYSYDARLATHPPPGFPTTANQYIVVSWQRVSPRCNRRTRRRAAPPVREARPFCRSAVFRRPGRVRWG